MTFLINWIRMTWPIGMLHWQQQHRRAKSTQSRVFGGKIVRTHIRDYWLQIVIEYNWRFPMIGIKSIEDKALIQFIKLSTLARRSFFVCLSSFTLYLVIRWTCNCQGMIYEQDEALRFCLVLHSQEQDSLFAEPSVAWLFAAMWNYLCFLD